MTAECAYRFTPGDDLRTAIGVCERGLIKVEPGRPGTALFGPYVDLPAGRYRALVRLSEAVPVAGSLTVDAFSFPDVLAERTVRADELETPCAIELEFVSAEPIPRAEVRLRTDGRFSGSVVDVEIKGRLGEVARSVEAGDLPVPRVPNMARRSRNLYEGYQRSMTFGRMPALARRVGQDPDYQTARTIAGDRTIVDDLKLMNLFLIFKFFLPKVPFGHVTEWGCYRGGGSLFMAYLAKRFLPDRRIYGFDTFAGMPPTDDAIDQHQVGSFSDGVDLGALRSYAADVGLDNLEFIEGRFEDTASSALSRIGPVALAHLDCDIRAAIETSYDLTRPHMVSGGYWVFDDPLVSDCMGAAEAVEDLLIRRDGLNSEQTFPHLVFRQP